MSFLDLNSIDVIYDDKVFGDVIDPNQWNNNFKIIEDTMNNNLESVNANFDSLEGVAEENSGADQIGATPVNEGGANTVQGVVNEINANLISHESNNEHIKAQNVIPIEQPFGGLWFQIIDDYDGTYGSVIIKNATASDGEIGDTSNFWLDT